MTDRLAANAAPLTLDVGSLLLEFDPGSGAIVACGDRSLGIDLVNRGEAAESWRLLVPLPDRRGHYVYGRDQVLRDAVLEGDTATLTWGPLRSELEPKLEIQVTLEARLGEGEVTFRASVENNSPYPIEEVIAPCIGGITRPADPGAWQLIGPRVISGGFAYPIFDAVPSSYHGPTRSNVLHPYPGGWTNPLSLGMPWVALVHDDGRGVYIGNHDPDTDFSAFFVELDAELRIESSGELAVFGSSAPQRWPEVAGVPPGSLTLGWASFPFAASGESAAGPPIVFSFLRGGWRAATERFRAEVESRPAVQPPRRTWLADADSWIAISMLFNDGTVEWGIEDLPRIAAEAAAIGVSALLLTGWSSGGLDGGYPFYRVDPRLGTEAEMSEALRRCQAEGVRVILMANVAQVHIETEWFRAEGHRYVVRNANGDSYQAGGVFYGFNTLLDQLGYTVPQMVTANPAHPEYRRLILDELESIAALGADAVLLDKVNTGDPYSLDFNPDLPGSPSDRFHRALEATVAELAQRLAGTEDFGIVIESGWDRVMPYCEAAYTRYFEPEHMPIQEVAFPAVRLSTTIVGDGDIPMVNNALRHGHVVCVEPRYYHGGMTDAPVLARYLAELNALRRRLRPLLWDGRIGLGEEVEVEGEVLSAVFERSPDAEPDPDASLAVVLMHFEPIAVDAVITIPGAERAVVHRPFREPEEVDLPLRTSVPANEYVVVVSSQPQ